LASYTTTNQWSHDGNFKWHCKVQSGLCTLICHVSTSAPFVSVINLSVILDV
jgi:hypothetical protein